MRNARLDEVQAGIKIARRNVNNPRDADDTTLMAESEELKSLLMKVKEESENVGVKLSSIQFSRSVVFDSLRCTVPGLPVHHQLPESTQTHVH